MSTHDANRFAATKAGFIRCGETAAPEYETFYAVLEGEPTVVGGPLKRLTARSVVSCVDLSPIWPGLDKRVAFWPDGTVWFVPVDPVDEDLREAYRLAQALEGLKGALYGMQVAADTIAKAERHAAGEG